MIDDSNSTGAREDFVAQYKRILARVLDTRPSGTRQHLATALGKHRSFVSQISNPAYATPIPVDHLSTIFTVCHFSTAEKRVFLDLYRQAHPRRQLPTGNGHGTRTISVTLPDLGEETNRHVDHLVAEFVRTLTQMAQTFASEASEASDASERERPSRGLD